MAFFWTMLFPAETIAAAPIRKSAIHTDDEKFSVIAVAIRGREAHVAKLGPASAVVVRDGVPLLTDVTLAIDGGYSLI